MVRSPAKVCEPRIACLLLHFGAVSGFLHIDSFIVSDTFGAPVFPFKFVTPFALSQAVCKAGRLSGFLSHGSATLL